MLVWICFPVFSSGTLLILLWEKSKSKLTSLAPSTLILLGLLSLSTARCRLSWSILLSVESNSLWLCLWCLSFDSFEQLLTQTFSYTPNRFACPSFPSLSPKKQRRQRRSLWLCPYHLESEHRVSSWKALKIHCELRGIFCTEFLGVESLPQFLSISVNYFSMFHFRCYKFTKTIVGEFWLPSWSVWSDVWQHEWWFLTIFPVNKWKTRKTYCFLTSRETWEGTLEFTKCIQENGTLKMMKMIN